MRNITLIILTLFLYNCGYSSIYKNLKLQNYKFEIITTKGNNEMNNLIKNQIKLYSNKDSINIYKLRINTNYKKEILTKDSLGKATEYTLSVTSQFTINYEQRTQVVTIEESINIKHLIDRFEQDIYEKNIKRNFASSIREKLISEMFNLHDN
ncbi:hypothetical protein OAM33_01905 [Candidatus Pelagibacter sp.]|nr:hypothetical protein [Candidatus Pelagibacter sp.]|tara:strand:- start:39 stop:497 length:459 start_codon:yes stop_codon:yes gene_type:complete